MAAVFCLTSLYVGRPEQDYFQESITFLRKTVRVTDVRVMPSEGCRKEALYSGGASRSGKVPNSGTCPASLRLASLVLVCFALHFATRCCSVVRLFEDVSIRRASITPSQ